MPLSAQLQTALNERREPLGDQFVDQLRKDFLTLMKNLKRVKTYSHALQLHGGFKTWRDRFAEFVAQIREDLEGRLRAAKMNLSYGKANVGWTEKHISDLSVAYKFLYELRDFPLQIGDKLYDPKRQTFGDMPEEAVFERYRDRVKKWEGRARRASRKTWKTLRTIANWTRQGGHWGGGEEPVSILTRERENIRLSGFKVQVVAYDETRSSHVEGIENLKAGLSFYSRRAKKVLPWLLTKAVPIIAEFQVSGARGAVGGYYHRSDKTVTLSFWTLTDDPARIAQVIAHEMGHHIHQTVLTTKARNAWNDLIKGSKIEIDLLDILRRGREKIAASSKGTGDWRVIMSAAMKTDKWENARIRLKAIAKLYSPWFSAAEWNGWVAEVRTIAAKFGMTVKSIEDEIRPDDKRDLDKLEKQIAKTDPELAMQIDTLQHDQSLADLKLYSLRRIADYINKGGQHTFMVPRRPITAYAGKNPEESFCEVLGLAVSRGPRALHPEVKGWFSRFAPGVRWEEVEYDPWASLMS